MTRLENDHVVGSLTVGVVSKSRVHQPFWAWFSSFQCWVRWPGEAQVTSPVSGDARMRGPVNHSSQREVPRWKGFEGEMMSRKEKHECCSKVL